MLSLSLSCGLAPRVICKQRDLTGDLVFTRLHAIDQESVVKTMHQDGQPNHLLPIVRGLERSDWATHSGLLEMRLKICFR